MKLVKYKNRKIYSPELHKYVKLDEVLRWVREDKALYIVDHATKNLVTERVLLSALTQEAERGKVRLDEIRQFIREV